MTLETRCNGHTIQQCVYSEHYVGFVLLLFVHLFAFVVDGAANDLLLLMLLLLLLLLFFHVFQFDVCLNQVCPRVQHTYIRLNGNTE